MTYTRDIHALHRYTILGQVLSLLLLLPGLVSLGLFFEPSLVGIAPQQQGVYRGQPVWLVAGVFFLLFATIIPFITRRWVRRLAWILRNVSPEAMLLSIQIDHDSDNTSYYALLSKTTGDTKEGEGWKVSIYNPSWDVTGLQEIEVPAKVYQEPGTDLPAVIETEQGLLWRMAGNGSVSRF
jgi:hypothetical protein